MWDWIYNHVILFFTNYPEALAIGMGTLFPIAASQTFIMVWLDPASTARIKLKYMSAIDFAASFCFTSVLWYFLDKSDARGLRIMVSLGISFLCFLVHWVMLRVVQKRWPWIEPPEDLPTINH